MKSLLTITCLTFCLLAAVVNAGAQQQLNFSNLPLVSSPAPMPIGYGQLDWGNFFYVNPFDWSGAGPGYQLGAQGEDVAFLGGAYYRLNKQCVGTLTDSLGFVLVSANVAGGYGPASVTAIAYKNGTYIGTANFFVGMSMQTLTFPASWGAVTEVQIQVTGATDDLVVYSLNLYTIGG